MKAQLVGQGSFARVYRAFNVATGHSIAVKQVEINRELTKLARKRRPNADPLESLRVEVTVLKELHHVNIIKYLGK